MFGARVTFPSDDGTKIWFYKKRTGSSSTVAAEEDEGGNLIIDGNGVAAEVIEHDIGATNGIIHVVDKVLGIASQSIQEKLAMDPMLS